MDESLSSQLQNQVSTHHQPAEQTFGIVNAGIATESSTASTEGALFLLIGQN